MSDATQERREVIFSGRVQGVGVRYMTRQIAERFAVTGFVRNLPDGDVQLVAEGSPAEIERFIAAVSAELARYITGTHATTSAAANEFPAFTIRH